MSITLKVNPSSMAAFKQSLLVATQRISAASQTGMANAAEQAFNQVQLKTPRRTGALASSGKLTNQSTSNLLKYTIGYGDSTINPLSGKTTSEYAPMVHEIFNPKHPDSYKWLELSMRAYAHENFLRDLASAIRAAL